MGQRNNSRDGSTFVQIEGKSTTIGGMIFAAMEWTTLYQRKRSIGKFFTPWQKEENFAE